MRGWLIASSDMLFGVLILSTTRRVFTFEKWNEFRVSISLIKTILVLISFYASERAWEKKGAENREG